MWFYHSDNANFWLFRISLDISQKALIVQIELKLAVETQFEIYGVSSIGYGYNNNLNVIRCSSIFAITRQ